MNEFAVLALVAIVLAFGTHVLVRPERYLRTRARDSFADLVEVCTRDRAMAERLVAAEIARGANSRERATLQAIARLLRDRSR